MDSTKIAEKIRLFRNVLNGKNKSGEKTNTFTNFSRFRYYVILYYCAESLIHREMGEDNNGFSLSYLEKTAKQLGINFDRGRVGFAVMNEGIDKKEIGLFIGNNNYKYYYITKKGMKYCERILKEMTVLEIHEIEYITLNKPSLKKLFRKL